MDVDLLSERLGRYAIGASRDLRAVAELAAGERLEAVVILLSVPVRGGHERFWAVQRSAVRSVEPVGDGLRLALEGQDDVTLADILPPARRDELAAAFSAGRGDPGH